MLFLLIAFLLAASVWAVILLPRLRVAILCVAVIVTGTFFGPAFFAIDGPLQISLDRLFLLAVLGLVAALMARGTLAIPPLRTADWLVIAMLGWYGLRTVTGGEPYESISPVGAYLFYVFLPGMVYAAVRLANPTDRDLSTIISVVIAVGVYLGVTAVWETRGWYSLIFPRYIGDPDIWEFLGRARGPLLNPSANGVVLTISLSFAVMRMLQGNRQQVAWYAGLSLIIGLGVICTMTRSVWIGAAVAVGILLWPSLPRWSRVLGMAALMLLTTLAAAGFKDQLVRMKRDKNLSAAESEKSIKLRPLLAIVAWEMFKDAPLSGHGFATYLQAARPYYSIRSYGLPLDQTRDYYQHNIFLSSVVETGLIGMLIFAGLLWQMAKTGWRLGADHRAPRMARTLGLGTLGGLAGYFVAGMFQDVVVMPMIQMYLLFLAALLFSADQRWRLQQGEWVKRQAAAARIPPAENAIDDAASPPEASPVHELVQP